MAYAMYLRKSRADMEAEAHGEGETLSRHEAILTALAARQGNDVIRIYREIVSGETIAARPQVQSLLCAVSSGAYEGVYAMEIERLARGDTMDQGRIAQVFLYSATKIITPLKTYDPQNELDMEFFEFGLFMSRREFKVINRRLQQGRLQALREGKYICSRPAYGYRRERAGDGRGYVLAVQVQEARVVRQIFDWYVNGDETGRQIGVSVIAARLADMHVPPGAQGGAWKPCRVYRILTNEVYLGKLRWGQLKTRRVLSSAGVEKTRVLTRDYQLFDGQHPAIVDSFTFQQAQAILHTRGASVPLSPQRSLSNPLARLVRCSCCGHTLRRKPATPRQGAILFCATRGCPCVSAYAEAVEQAVVYVLSQWLHAYELTGQYPFERSAGEQAHILSDSLASLREEAAQLEKQQKRLYELLETGVYSAEVFSQRMHELAARSEENAEAIQSVSAQLSSAPQAVHPENVAPRLRRVLDIYPLLVDAQQKNDLLRGVISHIVYEKTERNNQWTDHPFRLTLYPLFE